jgi:DNA-binding MarR family transcriptional regulator
MDRGLDRDDHPREEAASAPVTAAERLHPVGQDWTRAFALPDGRRREAVVVRDRSYAIRDTESRTLAVVGTFRVVFTRDLEQGVYDGHARRLARDLEALTAAGLLERRPFTRSRSGRPLDVVTLTPEGRALLEASRARTACGVGEPRQAVYAGVVRSPELLHDATLYRLYLEEAARLERDGATVRRVVLDHELKGALQRAAQATSPHTADERTAALARAATELHLPVVDGHVQIPDLRLEIEDAAGTRTRVDLELATEAYRAGQLRAKAAARREQKQRDRDKKERVPQPQVVAPPVKPAHPEVT